jgi:hypothetical protein
VVSVPVAWYPRLAEGTPRERRHWELIGPGIGIHWPDLDEDISVEALLLWTVLKRKPCFTSSLAGLETATG